MTRVGMGYDLHRLAEGRKLILGGIELVFHKGPVGHSDGCRRGEVGGRRNGDGTQK